MDIVNTPASEVIEGSSPEEKTTLTKSALPSIGSTEIEMQTTIVILDEVIPDVESVNELTSSSDEEIEPAKKKGDSILDIIIKEKILNRFLVCCGMIFIVISSVYGQIYQYFPWNLLIEIIIFIPTLNWTERIGYDIGKTHYLGYFVLLKIFVFIFILCCNGINDYFIHIISIVGIFFLIPLSIFFICSYMRELSEHLREQRNEPKGINWDKILASFGMISTTLTILIGMMYNQSIITCICICFDIFVFTEFWLSFLRNDKAMLIHILFIVIILTFIFLYAFSGDIFRSILSFSLIFISVVIILLFLKCDDSEYE